MSMQFRYRLAKDKFKGKKVPPKDDHSEEHIAEDQRGNKSFVKKMRVDSPSKPKDVKDKREDALLSLDKDTITEQSEPEIQTSKEVSRRDLFSIFSPTAYSEEVKQPKKKKKKKKRKKSKEEDDEKLIQEGAEVEMEEIPLEDIAEPSKSTVQDDSPKPGIFRRLWNWLKSPLTKKFTPIPQPVCVQSSDLTTTASAAITVENPDVLEIKVRVVQTEDDLAAEQANAEIQVKKEQQNLESSGEEWDEEDRDPEDTELSRRNLMRQGIHFFAKPAVENISDKIETVNKGIDKITKRKAMLRPPGAISERYFLQACTRCDACIHACPKDAIKRAPKSYGFLVMGTPFIDPIKKPCVMCDDLPCISACEDNALKPVQDIFDVKMGYAILDEDKCSAYSNMDCQQCVIDCPVPGAITQNKEMQPKIHKDICTGCGVCVRSCHTVNTPVAIKVKPAMVIENQLLKKKLEKEKEEKEAERLAKKTEEDAAEAASQSAVENEKL